MARWKKPSKSEILENRRTLAERAHCGDLRLPSAVVEIRKGIGMTQEEFAKVLGLTRRQIAEIEAGNANPTLGTLTKIGRLFGFELGFVPRSPDRKLLLAKGVS
ncbi:XRE family transcriptional regulator [Neorhizobium lilium]|uniref:XRE family transcriptional regulator n=1 Tax=Neorhizobium lilium TaxID=2503024 RepID=A0A444LI38_9HYPH|nr:helix-turn-helix transcriptional regulator [Neorhizobium lilium]RWX78574.1 XRE family transcriptional regulator [Neorhizobium lilium]